MRKNPTNIETEIESLPDVHELTIQQESRRLAASAAKINDELIVDHLSEAAQKGSSPP